MQSIEQRLCALEKNARRWRALAVMLAAGLAVVIVGAAGPANVPAVYDSIRTRELVVVNPDNEPVCEIASFSGCGDFRLYDQKHKARISAMAADGMSTFGVWGEKTTAIIHDISKQTPDRGTIEVEDTASHKTLWKSSER